MPNQWPDHVGIPAVEARQRRRRSAPGLGRVGLRAGRGSGPRRPGPPRPRRQSFRASSRRFGSSRAAASASASQALERPDRLADRPGGERVGVAQRGHQAPGRPTGRRACRARSPPRGGRPASGSFRSAEQRRQRLAVAADPRAPGGLEPDLGVGVGQGRRGSPRRASGVADRVERPEGVQPARRRVAACSSRATSGPTACGPAPRQDALRLEPDRAAPGDRAPRAGRPGRRPVGRGAGVTRSGPS